MLHAFRKQQLLPDSIPAHGVSSLAGAHGTLVPQLLRELARQAVHGPVVVGGIVPDEDARFLREQGVTELFNPGVTMHELIERLVQLIEAHRQDIRTFSRSISAAAPRSSQRKAVQEGRRKVEGSTQR